MGFLQSLVGNASSVSVEDVTREWGSILAKDEKIEVAYKLVRDYIIFTKNRLILIDVQGITGKKIEIKSVPFRSIVAFSVETAGVLDLNAELSIWVASTPFAIKKTFNKDVNIYEVQAVLADAIAFDKNN
ncbi:PH domain-containing protein [Sphaerochaeta sp. PS]|uniref:PH domain-containing protein n=1 Tax=Sphaerochaeta sp. PS TaxID=3076336 RepID=UPI0028A472C8|nr:PH domain-containing protein [Sphaerochaeta sp. PS]MDT4761733.1 PH domain-containing protein [Sphaerochaeta sp. PS]